MVMQTVLVGGERLGLESGPRSLGDGDAAAGKVFLLTAYLLSLYGMCICREVEREAGRAGGGQGGACRCTSQGLKD